MKNLIFFAAILVTLSSCKKDYGIDTSLSAQEDIISMIPTFYARGIVKDLYSNFEFMVDLDSFYTSLFAQSYTSNSPTTNTKSVFSKTGEEFPNWTGDWIHTDVSINLLTNSISVEIITDVPSDDEIALTKNQLLDFLKEDTSLSFGNQIGEITVGFGHLNIAGMPDFSQQGYRSFSNLFEGTDEMNTFEILSVEDYVQQGVINPDKGLIITAKINCFLGSINESDRFLELQDFEANFYFAYSE